MPSEYQNAVPKSFLGFLSDGRSTGEIGQGTVIYTAKLILAAPFRFYTCAIFIRVAPTNSVSVNRPLRPCLKGVYNFKRQGGHWLYVNRFTDLQLYFLKTSTVN